MLQGSCEDVERIGDVFMNGALNLTVLADELRFLRDLSPERKRNPEYLRDLSDDLEDIFDLALSSAKEISKTSIPTLMRFYLEVVKAPGSAYKILAPRWTHPEIAGDRFLSFPSMHHAVEFAANCILRAGDEIKSAIGSASEGDTSGLTELVEIGTCDLISLTHKNDENWSEALNGGPTVCEERLKAEAAGICRVLQGFEAVYRQNATDETFGDAITSHSFGKWKPMPQDIQRVKDALAKLKVKNPTVKSVAKAAQMRHTNVGIILKLLKESPK